MKAPTATPVKVPVSVPKAAPVKAPVKAPFKAPFNAPVPTPVLPPVEVAPVTPTSAPTWAPAAVDYAVARINVGGFPFMDSNGKFWNAETVADNGAVYWSCPKNILNTVNDDLYCTFRWYGPMHKTPYVVEIPVPFQANYLVRLHFAEIVSV
jgi:Malectin domain